MKEIKKLNPTALWGYFAEMTQIPRPSGFMGPIQEYIRQFGKANGLKTDQDAAGNIIIHKPATPGMEGKPGIVLQAHLDMVPQKNSNICLLYTSDAADE